MLLSVFGKFSKHGSFNVLCVSFFLFLSFLSLISTIYNSEIYQESSPINLTVYSQKNINEKYDYPVEHSIRVISKLFF